MKIAIIAIQRLKLRVRNNAIIVTSENEFPSFIFTTLSCKKQLYTIKAIIRIKINITSVINKVLSFYMLSKHYSSEQQALLSSLAYFILCLHSSQKIVLSLRGGCKLFSSFKIQAERHFRWAYLIDPLQVQGLMNLLLI